MSSIRLQVAPHDLGQLLEMLQNTSRREADRARIIVLSARGLTPAGIAKELQMAPATVYKWRKRYSTHGLAGLRDLPRPGQPRKLNDAERRKLRSWLATQLPDQGLAWSIRRLARQAQITEHQARGLLTDERAACAATKLQRLPERAALPPRLCSLYVAAPWLGVALIPETDAWPETLTPSAGFGPSYRSNPKSLFRAFDVSHGAGPDTPGARGGLSSWLQRLSDAVPDPHELRIFSCPPAVMPSAGRGLTMTLTRSVSSWLLGMESYLCAWEEVAYASETMHSEARLLRANLERYCRIHRVASGVPFEWHSPSAGSRTSQ